LIGQPYVYKFLWAPLLDRFSIGRWGRRKGWILVMQLCTACGLMVMAFLSPGKQPFLLAIVALITAFFSASQDVAIDAYGTDLLTVSERSIGATAKTLGPRLALIVGGSVALIVAAKWGWRVTYLGMAGLMFVLMGMTFFVPSAEHPNLVPK